MHPDLAGHLHTPECNEIIQKLKECHESNTFSKFLGICNSIDTELTRCLRKERIENQKANREQALQRQQHISELLKAKAEKNYQDQQKN